MMTPPIRWCWRLATQLREWRSSSWKVQSSEFCRSFFQAIIANRWWMQSDFSRRMLARQASAGDEDPVPEESGF
jgi:hypothetical protein